MFSLQRWGEILEAMEKDRLRTFLTGLSVASGIFIFVILLGVGNGMKNGITEQFAGSDLNSFIVVPRKTSVSYKGHNPGRKIKATEQDYRNVSQQVSNDIDKSSPLIRIKGAEVSYKNEYNNYAVMGVSPDYLEIEACKLQTGRFLNIRDIQNFEKVAFIGKTIKKELFAKENNPIGKYIKINNAQFLVIGVYTDPGGNRQENRIYIPFGVAQKVFGKTNQVDRLAYSLKSNKNTANYVTYANHVFDRAKNVFKKRYQIAPNDNAAIAVWQNLEESQRVFGLLNAIEIFFWIIGMCTIVAGMVGVANIMFIVVKERTKEIGIRKALGAKPSSIIGMILHESIFITVFSGIFGLILGLGLLELIGPNISSDFFKNPSIDFSSAIKALIVLIISGALAGYIPARKAARVQPIEALRDE